MVIWAKRKVSAMQSACLRKLVFAIGVAIVAASPAAAQEPYAWCAQYRPPLDATNCGFVSYQQCMATITGIGGICYRNPAYPGPRAPRKRSAPRQD
jgi:hypothetical protein